MGSGRTFLFGKVKGSRGPPVSVLLVSLSVPSVLRKSGGDGLVDKQTGKSLIES